MELCRENRCRRKHHQLLHVEKGLEEERPGEQPPAESSVAAPVSGSVQAGERWSPGRLVTQWIRTPKGGPCLAFWDTGSQVTLVTNRAVQAMGLQAIPSPFVRLDGIGGSRGTTVRARYKVPLIDIGGRVVKMDAFGVENITSPLEGGDLAAMKAAFPEVPAGGLVAAAGEVSLLVGQDNYRLFPTERRRVGDAALYGSRFGTGFIAAGGPPRTKGDGGNEGTETCTAKQEEHELEEAADCPKPPGDLSGSPECDKMQTATTAATAAQAIGGQSEAVACETPLPWEEEYDDDMTIEEDGQLDWEVGQHLWGSDWEDDEDFLDSQRSYSGRERGDEADNGWRAAACGAARVMATRPVAAPEETTADEERRAALMAAYLTLIADGDARRRTRLTNMKQRLPSLATQLRKLWQDVGCVRRSAPTKVLLRASALVDKQLGKAETLLQLTEENLKPEEKYLMEAEVYLRSARELLEAIETRIAPAEAPPRSPTEAVVGFLRAGEPIERHHRQDDQQKARVSPAASGGGDPRGDGRAVCQDQVSTRRPPRGMVWSLQKRAWCPPGEFRGRRRRRRRRRERDAGDAASRRANEMVPRDGLAALRTGGEKRVTAERHERPPPETPERWSGGETVGIDAGGWPERVETRRPSSGGRTTASTCGECGRDRDMDKRKQRWRHGGGEAQQEDAARRPEIETSEPVGWKGQWLGETEAARGEPLHAAPKSGEQAGQPQPRGKSCGAPGEQRPEGGEHAGSPRDEGSDRSGAWHQGIGLSVAVILLILILMSILRTALDIASRAIAVMRARSRGWWLTGTPWGPLLQGVVALVQWTLARRRASSRAAGRVMEDKEDREGTTPAGTRLLIRSSPDRGSVLLHRDQHFIERESYRSGREMALEIQDMSWYMACTISPLRCVMANRASGPSFQLSLIPSRCREERVSSTSPSGSLDLEEGGLSARSCLRDSQAICSSQECLETIICNEDIDNKDRNHLQRTGGVS
jgi:hypothetical protein